MSHSVPTIRTEPIIRPRGAHRCDSSYRYGGMAGDQCARERGHDGPQREMADTELGREYRHQEGAEEELRAQLSVEQQTLLAKQRAVAEKAWADARKVFDESEDNPDAAAKRRRNRVAQKAADARDLYDSTAEAFGAPKLPPLQRKTRPAGPRPRSTDEAAINTAKQELAAVAARSAANFRGGGRRMKRGKQALQRGDAQLRRAAAYGRQTEQIKTRLRALGVPDAEIEATISAAWG